MQFSVEILTNVARNVLSHLTVVGQRFAEISPKGTRQQLAKINCSGRTIDGIHIGLINELRCAGVVVDCHLSFATSND